SFFFQAEDGIRDPLVTGVQTCALPISVLPDEIPRWLKQCDTGVLATRQDAFLDLSFSGKLSEYIIMKRAVICARLKTIRHYFSEEALAFFEPNNPSDLAQQMLRMAEDTNVRI